MKINNRRYIGSKTKLLPELEKILYNYPSEKYPIFFDAFGGTGVVTDLANHLGYKTYINDMLFSNFVSYNAWFSSEEIRYEIVNNYIKEFNELTPSDGVTYFSEIYGGKYFTVDIANKINNIRELIEEKKSLFNKREYFYLLTSLLYATDKCANTVGHFEHYLKNGHEKRVFELLPLEVENFESKIICADINSYVAENKVKCDVLYLDPPYNARQYINFYHVLENLARWEKPTEFEGTSMKFKRDHLKSEYSKKDALLHFKDLIEKVDAKIIILSYNNTYNARSGASNNKMQEKDILSVLSTKGEVEVFDVNYKAFQSGKTNLKNHVEKFFITRIK